MNEVGETLIKICGMRRKEDIEAANRCRPDYIGFILSAGYRRSVGPAEAEALAKMTEPGIRKVGVFVNEPVGKVAEASGFLDMIQLHGTEDNAYIMKLRERTGKTIIQAFRIRKAEDLARAAESEADILLLDNGTGTGQDNIAEAAGRFRPFAVDLSSGAETDGWKDPVKMEQCVRAVRNARSGGAAGDI